MCEGRGAGLQNQQTYMPNEGPQGCHQCACYVLCAPWCKSHLSTAPVGISTWQAHVDGQLQSSLCISRRCCNPVLAPALTRNSIRHHAALIHIQGACTQCNSGAVHHKQQQDQQSHWDAAYHHTVLPGCLSCFWQCCSLNGSFSEQTGKQRQLTTKPGWHQTGIRKRRSIWR